MALPKQAEDADADSNKKEKLKFDIVGYAAKGAAKRLIEANFKIDRVVGLIQLNDGSFVEAKSGPCICVSPRFPSNQQQNDKKKAKYHSVSLFKQKQFRFESVIGNPAGAHQLIFVFKNKKWIKTIGKELSHICHRHK